MKRAYRILPCYTGDVSGVCSALYELGGMVVIHDPSGCNSTYNTHDETRWYDRDSMIFISGLSEMDAILGADEKLVTEISETALALHPKFIALVSSPVPYMNGTDFPALARLIQGKTGIDCFFVPTNGMHDYVAGAGQAFLTLAKRYVLEEKPVIPRSVNILGLTPLDFGAADTEQALRGRLEEWGYSVLSCWAMGSRLEELRTAGQAQVNLVVSAAGLPTARELWQRFGTPFAAGIPCGDGEDTRLAMEQAIKTGENQMPCRHRPKGGAELTLIGEPVTMGSLGAAIGRRYGKSVRVVCPVEADPILLAPEDQLVRGEEELEAAIANAGRIVADPLYRAVCPETAAFYDLPHQAFSGRSGWKTTRNLITLEI